MIDIIEIKDKIVHFHYNLVEFPKELIGKRNLISFDDMSFSSKASASYKEVTFFKDYDSDAYIDVNIEDVNHEGYSEFNIAVDFDFMDTKSQLVAILYNVDDEEVDRQYFNYISRDTYTTSIVVPKDHKLKFIRIKVEWGESENKGGATISFPYLISGQFNGDYKWRPTPEEIGYNVILDDYQLSVIGDTIYVPEIIEGECEDDVIMEIKDTLKIHRFSDDN